MILSEKQFVDYWTDAMKHMPEQGSQAYTRELRKIYNYCIVDNKCPRPSDLCCSLVCRYIENYQIMYEKKHGVEMNPANIFKIRLPWWLHDKAYEI